MKKGQTRVQVVADIQKFALRAHYGRTACIACCSDKGIVLARGGRGLLGGVTFWGDFARHAPGALLLH